MAAVEGGVVGAGTLLTAADIAAAVEAGAKFGVSPGATPALLDAAEEAGLPMLPGAATSTEAMLLLERGYTVQKFFPAEVSGGAPALKAIGAPLPQNLVLPDGWRVAEERGCLSVAAQRALRRRLVGRAGRGRPRRRLGPRHRTRVGGGRPAPLTRRRPPRRLALCVCAVASRRMRVIGWSAEGARASRTAERSATSVPSGSPRTQSRKIDRHSASPISSMR